MLHNSLYSVKESLNKGASSWIFLPVSLTSAVFQINLSLIGKLTNSIKRLKLNDILFRFYAIHYTSFLSIPEKSSDRLKPKTWWEKILYLLTSAKVILLACFLISVSPRRSFILRYLQEQRLWRVNARSFTYKFHTSKFLGSMQVLCLHFLSVFF